MQIIQSLVHGAEPFQWLDKMPSSQAMLTHLLKPITRQSSLAVDLSLATIATSALGVQTSPEPMAGVPGSVSPEWPQTVHNHLCHKMPIIADILRYSIGGQRTYCILIVCMCLFTIKWTTKTSGFVAWLLHGKAHQRLFAICHLHLESSTLGAGSTGLKCDWN
jgi:hypothetical protein